MSLELRAAPVVFSIVGAFADALALSNEVRGNSGFSDSLCMKENCVIGEKSLNSTAGYEGFPVILRDRMSLLFHDKGSTILFI